jgi:hypothetical protein
MAAHRTAPVTPRGVRRDRTWRAVAAVVALATVVRLVVLLHPGPLALDADEAVTGLMARRIAAGQQQFVYFSGQQYNGSLEQYLQAGMYLLFRLPQTPFTLRLVQVVLAAATTWVVYLAAREVFGSHRVAVLAAAIFAVGPYWNVWLSTRSYGAYDAVQLIAVLGVWCALRGWRTRRLGWVAGFGLCCGLTLWLGWSGFEVLLAAAIWLVPLVVRSITRIAAVLGAAIIGALPVIVTTVRDGGGLTGAFGAGPQPQTTVWQRFGRLLHPVGGEFLGVRYRSNVTGLPVALEVSVVVAVLVALLAALVVRRRGLLAVLTLRSAHRRPVDLVLLVFPVAIVLYLLAEYSWYVGTPRYLFVLYPVGCVAAAGLTSTLARWGRRHRREWVRTAVPALVVVVAALLVLGTVNGVVHNRAVDDPERFDLTTDAEIRRANRWLLDHGYHAAYAQYWTAMPAEYFAPEGLHVAPTNVGRTKSTYATEQVDASDTFVYLASNRVKVDYTKVIRRALDDHGVTYRAVQLGTVIVFADLSQQLRPAQLGIRV